MRHTLTAIVVIVVVLVLAVALVALTVASGSGGEAKQTPIINRACSHEEFGAGTTPTSTEVPCP